MTKALIIVDVQNDFITGALNIGGGMEMDGLELAARLRKTLLNESPVLNRRDYDYVVTTQDWHINPGAHWARRTDPDFKDSWPVHCVAGEQGAELADDIKNLPVDANFRKGHYNAAYSGFEGIVALNPFEKLTLHGWLRDKGVTEVDIVGIALDYCVKATALDAQKLGYKTRVLKVFTVSVDGYDGGTGAQATAELREAGVDVPELIGPPIT